MAVEKITDNSKVNENLLKEVNALKKQNKELIEVLKETHNLYGQAVKDKHMTHDITRLMTNEMIFQGVENQ